MEVYRTMKLYKENCDILKNKKTKDGVAVVTCIAPNVSEEHRKMCPYYPVIEDPDEKDTY